METKDQYSASTLKKLILDTIKNEMLIEPELASDDAYYEAVCRVIRRILTERYKVFNAHANSVATKKVYYMSMEFLTRRTLKNTLYNLCIQDQMAHALTQLDYEFGIFKQRIIDGWQTETPDYWLPGGSVWLTSKPDRTVPVHFGGRIEEGWQDGHHTINHVDYQTIYAVPYDMYVPGFQGEGVAILRLWKAQSPGLSLIHI